MKKKKENNCEVEPNEVWVETEKTIEPSPYFLKWWQDASILKYGDASHWLDVGAEFGYMFKKIDQNTKEISYIPEGFDYRLTYQKSLGIPDNMPIIAAHKDAEHFKHLWDRLLREHGND